MTSQTKLFAEGIAREIDRRKFLKKAADAAFVLVAFTSSCVRREWLSSPTASVGKGLCTRHRMQALTDGFFRAYNDRDLGNFLSLFDFSEGFYYVDSPEAARVAQLSDRRRLVSYVESRWSIGDRFTSFAAGPPTEQDVYHFPDANPSGDFVRVFSGKKYRGTVKFVCRDGSFVGVVMQSRETDG